MGASIELPGPKRFDEGLGLFHGGDALLGPAGVVSKGLREGVKAPLGLPDPAYLGLALGPEVQNQPLPLTCLLPEEFQCPNPFNL